MSAELLRRAADTIEKFTEGTTPGSWNGHISTDGPGFGAVYGGPWQDGYRTGNVMGWCEEAVEEYGGEPSSADLRWLCLMSPHIAAPLAAWLRADADEIAEEQRERTEECVECDGTGQVYNGDPLPFRCTDCEVTREDGWPPLAFARALLDEEAS